MDIRIVYKPGKYYDGKTDKRLSIDGFDNSDGFEFVPKEGTPLFLRVYKSLHDKTIEYYIPIDSIDNFMVTISRSKQDV